AGLSKHMSAMAQPMHESLAAYLLNSDSGILSQQAHASRARAFYSAQWASSGVESHQSRLTF
ncbi:hypothetical protein HaLaN_12344, partial [Haematococcus lacustris]